MGTLSKAHVLSYSQDVADLFEPSVKAIIEAFEQQRRVASTPVNVGSLFITDRQMVTMF
jgi:hypothetical protein